ncbi:MAG: type II toxin-antitoxin system VapC family toxin [Acidobacteriaceae bacterium]|nr:type II toxin-antitoxin system VapC family toxin [Acidobacteriaceae bacterium]
MSGFLLDTNIPSEFRNLRPAPRVVRWLDSIDERSLFISVITLGELRKGCELLELGKRRHDLERWLDIEVRDWFADRILPLTDAIADLWGRLEARRQRLGLPLNTADGQIAATALEHNLTVVTRNVEDFEELGVRIHNPWES